MLRSSGGGGTTSGNNAELCFRPRSNFPLGGLDDAPVGLETGPARPRRERSRNLSTFDQRNQPQECDLAPRRDLERLVQVHNLVVVEENEEAVAFERGYGVC
jgi:hypothetical protein